MQRVLPDLEANWPGDTRGGVGLAGFGFVLGGGQHASKAHFRDTSTSFFSLFMVRLPSFPLESAPLARDRLRLKKRGVRRRISSGAFGEEVSHKLD